MRIAGILTYAQDWSLAIGSKAALSLHRDIPRIQGLRKIRRHPGHRRWLLRGSACKPPCNRVVRYEAFRTGSIWSGGSLPTAGFHPHNEGFVSWNPGKQGNFYTLGTAVQGHCSQHKKLAAHYFSGRNLIYWTWFLLELSVHHIPRGFSEPSFYFIYWLTVYRATSLRSTRAVIRYLEKSSISQSKFFYFHFPCISYSDYMMYNIIGYRILCDTYSMSDCSVYGYFQV